MLYSGSELAFQTKRNFEKGVASYLPLDYLCIVRRAFHMTLTVRVNPGRAGKLMQRVNRRAGSGMFSLALQNFFNMLGKLNTEEVSKVQRISTFHFESHSEGFCVPFELSVTGKNHDPIKKWYT